MLLLLMQWFRREKMVLQLTFLLISNLFSQKTIWVTIFEFQFAFSSKNEHEGSLLLSEVRKII